jgi:outer membrane protein assembly factor BamD
LAENSVANKQLDRYLDMLDHYYTFIAEFPESKRVKELERMAKDARNFIDKNRSTNRE